MTATMGRRKMFDTDIIVGFEKYWLLALYWLTIYFVSTNRRNQARVVVAISFPYRLSLSDSAIHSQQGPHPIQVFEVNMYRHFSLGER
jgi:hypothetical protein